MEEDSDENRAVSNCFCDDGFDAGRASLRRKTPTIIVSSLIEVCLSSMLIVSNSGPWSREIMTRDS